MRPCSKYVVVSSSAEVVADSNKCKHDSEEDTTTRAYSVANEPPIHSTCAAERRRPLSQCLHHFSFPDKGSAGVAPKCHQEAEELSESCRLRPAYITYAGRQHPECARWGSEAAGQAQEIGQDIEGHVRGSIGRVQTIDSSVRFKSTWYIKFPHAKRELD